MNIEFLFHLNSNSSSKLTNARLKWNFHCSKNSIKIVPKYKRISKKYLKQTHSQQLNTSIRSLRSDSWYSKIGFVLMTSYAKNFNFEGKIFDSNTTWQRNADNHNMKTYNSNIFSHIHSLVLISIDNVSDTDCLTNTIQGTDY